MEQNKPDIGEIRSAILSGQRVEFDLTAPQEMRVVPSSILMEAVKTRVPINLTNAAVTGALSLKYGTLVEEVSIKGCEFDSPVDLSFIKSRAVGEYIRTRSDLRICEV
jgi:hypothetical protein